MHARLIKADFKLPQYSLAVFFVLTTTGLALISRQSIEPGIFPPILAAVMVSACLGGSGAELFATALAAFAVSYFFRLPLNSFANFEQVLLLVPVACLMSWLAREDAGSRQSGETPQTLSQKLIAAQEAERSRVARELHDEIGQALTAIKLNLQAVQSAAGDGPLAGRLKESMVIVDRALRQTRDLSLRLRPMLLDDLGLVAALRWHIDHWAQQAGVQAEFVAQLSAARLSPELETACFRIAQEALTNVMRHARASQIRVELTQRGAELHLDIRDDGVGFDPDALAKGRASEAALGLQGMRERALIMNGDIEIKSSARQGAAIHARFPVTLAAPRQTRRAGDAR